MTLPTKQAFSTLPNGGVWTTNLTDYAMKCDATTWVHLGTGAIMTGADPAALVQYFPNANLNLG